MKRLFCLLLLSLSACQSDVLNAPTLPGEDQLRADVYWLAEDAREGRLPGTPGAEQAASYIENRFHELGLKPLPAIGGYQQRFSMPGRVMIGPNTTLRIAGTGQQLNTDFRPMAFSANGTFSGSVAFVGYGVVSKKYKYDDYAGIDLTDRVVIAMRYEPHTADGKSRFTQGAVSADAAITSKGTAARERGAKALLLVNPPLHHADDAPLRPFVSQGVNAKSPIPVISITPQVAEKLLGGRSLASLQEQIDQSGNPSLLLINDITISGEVNLQTTPISAANVVAALPGTGPSKNEYIVIGAHYDHVGRGEVSSRRPDSGTIHNGADDNASGVAAMLGVARQLANHRLSRTVVFAAFTGEESGLIGSRYFVDHPPVPMDDIVAMINLDMVGRLRKNTLFIGGGGTRPAFRKILDDIDRKSPLEFKSIGEGGFGPSDQQSFAIKKVPVLFFFTGLHAQYHHPDDDAALVSYEGLRQITGITTEIVQRLAAAPREAYVGRFDAAGMNAEIDPSSTRPTSQATSQLTAQPATLSARASLGVVPDYGSDITTGGVRIGGAVPESPAATAGLLDGDILVGFGDKPIGNLYDLTDCLQKAAPGDEVEIAYIRDGKRATVRVRLAEGRRTN